ncbi:hypothetical protein PanWU01x14_234340 [Parasponia andersonii]|uniref:Uncharacterized protein n=1 Tax=Parasponia andersonii TaxID=3476 RepID=A0A2P5BIV7_PARAD|nr:hypothetical protein PanWU01x14_234340 [Parasponia andersonii]
MEGRSRREEVCPQLLDLIPQNREWLVNRVKERSHGSSEEKKLELRLGPPGQEWPLKENNRERDESLLSLGYFSPMASGTHNTTNINNSGNQGSVRSFSPWSSTEKKAFSPATTPSPAPAANTAVPNSSQKSGTRAKVPLLRQPQVIEDEDPTTTIFGYLPVKFRSRFALM